MYIANGQLDERSRPIDNKYAFMNKHASNSHVLYAKKPHVNQSILVLLIRDLHKAILSSN